MSLRIQISDPCDRRSNLRRADGQKGHVGLALIRGQEGQVAQSTLRSARGDAAAALHDTRVPFTAPRRPFPPKEGLRLAPGTDEKRLARWGARLLRRA
jgi:hypothetical protein